MFMIKFYYKPITDIGGGEFVRRRIRRLYRLHVSVLDGTLNLIHWANTILGVVVCSGTRNQGYLFIFAMSFAMRSTESYVA